jgi:hypothetical protein
MYTSAWTKEETALLLDLRKKGYRTKEISTVLGTRTCKAVERKLGALGVGVDTIDV